MLQNSPSSPIIGQGLVPSVSVSGNAGTGATAFIDSAMINANGNSFRVIIATGTAGVGTGTMCTCTFAIPAPTSNLYAICITPEGTTAATAVPYIINHTTTVFDIAVLNNPGISSAMIIDVHIFG